MMVRAALALLLFLASSALARTLLLADLGWRDPWTTLVEWTLGFAFKLYLNVYPLLRQPGYDDIQYGSCRIPHCDGWSLLLVVVVSAAAYLLVAHVVLAIRGRLSARRDR